MNKKHIDRINLHMYPGRRVGWVAVLLIHTVCLAPAWAEDARPQGSILEKHGLKQEAIEEQGAQLVALTNEIGVWFPMPSARKLLADVMRTAEISALAQRLEARLTTELTRVELLEKDIANREKGLLNCNNAHAACLKKLEAHTPKWWKAKSLWFTVGVIVGGGLVTGIALATR